MTFIKRSDSTILRKRSRTMTPPRPASDEQRRRVQFAADDSVNEIDDHVRPDERVNVWFSMDYLQLARKEEIKNNMRAQYFGKASPVDNSIESDTLTWRGMEDILEKYSRQDKSRAHVSMVLRKFRVQPDNSTRQAQNSLRQYASALSKADRHKAHNLGTQDEKAVFCGKRHHRTNSPLDLFSKNAPDFFAKTKTGLSSSVRSWTPPRSWKKNNGVRSWRLTRSSSGVSTRTMASHDGEEEGHGKEVQ